jgi:hypothetical protein
MTARGSLRSTTLPSSRWLPMMRCTDLLPAARPPRRQRAVRRRWRRAACWRARQHARGRRTLADEVANLEAVKRLQGRVACLKLALRVRGRQRRRRAASRRVAAPGVLGGTCSSMMLHSLGPSSAVRTMISLHGWSHTPLPPPPIPPKPISPKPAPTLPCLSEP